MDAPQDKVQGETQVRRLPRHARLRATCAAQRARAAAEAPLLVRRSSPCSPT